MKPFFLVTFLFILMSLAKAQSIFTDLTGVQFGDSIMLNWTLKGGSTCFDMHLMRSTDSVSFESVFVVEGVCGATDDQYYTFIDHENLTNGSMYYYRIEASGGTEQSDIISVIFIDAGKYELYVYPNPADHDLIITIDNRFTPSFLVELYSLQGRLLLQSVQHVNLFSLNTTQLAASPYMLKITTEDGAVFGGEVIVK